MFRRRIPEDVYSNDVINDQSTAQPSSRASSSIKDNALYKRFDLESLLWIIICAVMMYYTDFWPAIMYDLRVKRSYFYASISLFIVAVVIMIYCMMKMPTLNYNNWLQEGPVITPILTIVVLLGSLCLMISLWPIWGLITPVILFIALMAFISLLVTIG